MGHLPATTLGAYAHVIRELKGEPACRPSSRSSGPAGSCRDASAMAADG
jgi:hypothetical protein